MKDKESFINKLESKSKQEYSRMLKVFFEFKIRKDHPFYLLIGRSLSKAELMKILKTKSDILVDENGIFEIPKILNKLENI